MNLLINVYEISGKYTLLQYSLLCECCGTIKDPFVLKNVIESGLWPQSPKSFACMFKDEVFSLWDQFRKQMPGSSEKAFLESLNHLTKQNGRVSNVLLF